MTEAVWVKVNQMNLHRFSLTHPHPHPHTHTHIHARTVLGSIQIKQHLYRIYENLQVNSHVARNPYPVVSSLIDLNRFRFPW